jgi:hypothetical protein
LALFLLAFHIEDHIKVALEILAFKFGPNLLLDFLRLGVNVIQESAVHSLRASKATEKVFNLLAIHILLFDYITKITLFYNPTGGVALAGLPRTGDYTGSTPTSSVPSPWLILVWKMVVASSRLIAIQYSVSVHASPVRWSW